MLLGVVLSLTIFGVVVASRRLRCEIDPLSRIAPIVGSRQLASAVTDGTDAFVIGGFNNDLFEPLNDLFRYDRKNNIYFPLAPMLTAVSGAAAVYDPDNNKIYLCGGQDSTFGITNKMQVYDKTANTWSYGPNLPDIRENMAIGFYNGNIYLSVVTTEFNHKQRRGASTLRPASLLTYRRPRSSEVAPFFVYSVAIFSSAAG